MDRKLPSLENEINELRDDLNLARTNCSDFQNQITKSIQAYEALKEKKEKYQSDLSKC